VSSPPGAFFSTSRHASSKLYEYDQVSAMLLKEFFKEHRKVGELKVAMAQQQRKGFAAATVQQQKTSEALVARLNEQEAKIQKVSAQMKCVTRRGKCWLETVNPAFI
jgi:prenyltransferase beta subunit